MDFLPKYVYNLKCHHGHDYPSDSSTLKSLIWGGILIYSYTVLFHGLSCLVRINIILFACLIF